MAFAYFSLMSADQMAKFLLVDPRIHGGEPVFRGTRVPVQSLFDHLESGDSIEQFLDGFRTVKREQVIGLLEILRAETLAVAS